MDNLSQSFANPNPEKVINTKHENTGLSLVTIGLIIIFFIMTGFGAYQLYQINSIKKQITTTETELINLKESNLNDNKSITTQLKAQFLSQKSNNRIFWTNVLYNIDNNLPNQDLIEINSISGTENGTVTINANTSDNSLDPFTDTANLITVFKTKPFFQNVFIPNINSTIDETGNGRLSYTLRLNYKKEQTEKTPIKPTEIINTDPQATAPQQADPAVIEELRQRLNQPTNE